MDLNRVKEDRAKKLDEMLKLCDTPEGFHLYKDIDRTTYDDLCITANMLKNKGFIEIKVQQDKVLIISIKQDGRSFARNDSFTAMYQDNQKTLKQEDEQSDLTRRQIKAYKREPYLIVWTIITTLTSIILTIMQLKK